MTIEDMAGGTFTISNGGIYGSLMGMNPILSYGSLFDRNTNHQFTTDCCSWVACYERATSGRQRADCRPSYDVFGFVSCRSLC